QGFRSSQTSGAPAMQVPARHVSAPLQTLPSLQAVPSSTGVYTQLRTGSQASVVQGLLSVQLSAAPAGQTPPWQTSLPLQTLPSLHGVPLMSGVLMHPRIGSQASDVQRLLSSQLSAVPAVQAPL